MILGVRSWAIVVGLATIAAGFLGAPIGGWKSSPPDPRDCVSTVEIISSVQPARRCYGGARLEAWPAGVASVLVKCICPPVAK